jgi:hypothetical protein
MLERPAFVSGRQAQRVARPGPQLLRIGRRGRPAFVIVPLARTHCSLKKNYPAMSIYELLDRRKGETETRVGIRRDRNKTHSRLESGRVISALVHAPWSSVQPFVLTKLLATITKIAA